MFGWETARIIIPLSTIVSIGESDGGTISIKTTQNGLHELDCFDDDVVVVRNSLVEAWKDRENENDSDGDNDAVRHLYRRVCLLPGSPNGNESDTEEDASDEYSIDSTEARVIRDLPGTDDLQATLWQEMQNSGGEKFTENVAEVSLGNSLK